MAEESPVRRIRIAIVAALIGLIALPATARAQQEQPPLEDVTLRGRVLRSDGTPLANTALRVDARTGGSGLAFFGFFFTLGFSSISCFTGGSELCPIPNSKRFNSSTDANGNYSFTFTNAHRRGQQTDTDYILSVGTPSRAGGDKVVVASYELELIDAVHNAPDLVMWDPAVKVTPRARGYELAYPRRPDSKNSHRVMVADKEARLSVNDGTIDARDIEDATINVIPNASKDVTAAGTIYHQRFVAASVTLKGPLVPLSRGAACSATLADGSQAPQCGYTDGDLVTAGIDDRTSCRYDFDTDQRVRAGSPSGPSVPCVKPSATIDLGAAKKVGEVRTRCGCDVEGSSDGVAWRKLPAGQFPSSQSLRYVRVTGSSVASTPEISVWPPWSDDIAATPLAPAKSAEPTKDKPVRVTPLAGGDDQPRSNKGTPWVVVGIALVALAGVAVRRKLTRV